MKIKNKHPKLLRLSILQRIVELIVYLILLPIGLTKIILVFFTSIIEAIYDFANDKLLKIGHYLFLKSEENEIVKNERIRPKMTAKSLYLYLYMLDKQDEENK